MFIMSILKLNIIIILNKKINNIIIFLSKTIRSNLHNTSKQSKTYKKK